MEKICKNKHVGISFYKIREASAARIITLHYAHSHENIVDILTKALGIPEHNNITNRVLK